MKQAEVKVERRATAVYLNLSLSLNLLRTGELFLSILLGVTSSFVLPNPPEIS